MDLSKKMRNADDFIKHLYVHMNELNQFVIFSGLTFQEFVSSVDQLENLLLLKNDNENEDGSFNMHTRLAFVEESDLTKFSKVMSDKKGDLCWIDFSEEKKLNLLTPQEQAELLYIGHKNEPIRTPFYHQLQNRFVYLEKKDDRVTKVYFRELNDVNELVMTYFNNIVQAKERAASFWRRKPTSSTLAFNFKNYDEVREIFNDGVLLSVYRVEKPKVSYMLELRDVPEINFPEEIWDDLNTILKRQPNVLVEATVKK
ncbi:hypothetical protein DEX24_10825 [Kurthia sibirica]|uniref:Uncharacterized protein n=1 Tax=Kurthia sibirica TaxID=202750 RepID=A0A2U3AKC9_9BACL|nr:hypothetical protein DEX24_10825 [Kurthia sibirica]